MATVVRGQETPSPDVDQRLMKSYEPPPGVSGDGGKYRSPLQFADGRRVKSAEDWKKERIGLENSANSWANQFEIPGENFQVAVDEALFFSNNDRVDNDLLRDSGDRLVGYLKEIKEPNAATT